MNKMRMEALEKLTRELEEINTKLEEIQKKNEGKGKNVSEQMMEAQQKQATILIRYIMKRCTESDTLCESVVQEHKSWTRCMKYVTEKAREFAVNQVACIEGTVVFEWAEDYFRLDDKEAVEKEIAEENARKERAEKQRAELAAKEAKRKAAQKKKQEKEEAAEAKAEEKTDVEEEETPADDDGSESDTIAEAPVNEQPDTNSISCDIDMDMAQMSIFDMQM